MRGYWRGGCRKERVLEMRVLERRVLLERVLERRM